MEPSCDLALQLPPETSCTPEAMPEYAKLNKADSVHAQSLPLPAPFACPSEACRWGRQCRRDAEVSLSSGHPTSAFTQVSFQNNKRNDSNYRRVVMVIMVMIAIVVVTANALVLFCESPHRLGTVATTLQNCSRPHWWW